MTPTNGIPQKEWLRQHGIDRQRLDGFSVAADMRYFVNDDKKSGRAIGDIAGAQVTHRDWSGWSFTVDLSGSGGVLSFAASLDSEARLRGETITVRRLRDVPIADMALAVRAAFAMGNEGGAFAGVGAPVRKRETGPSPVTDRHLVEAMRVYVDAVADGHSTKEAALRFHVSESTMNDYRNRAKRRGLFVTHGRGKPGGDLTPKAWALMKEGDK